MNNEQKTRFSVAIATPVYKSLIANTLSDPGRCARFTASITSAVANNAAMQECTAQSVIAGALLGESLNLSPAPQFGQFYLVPFEQTVKDKNGNICYMVDESGRRIKKTVKQAQFILGYKGYIQLAIRSGYYRHINVLEVKEGELISYNPFTEEFEAEWIRDPGKRAAAHTVGYVARFEYINGFTKLLYWTKEKMVIHADKYSKAFSAYAIDDPNPRRCRVSFSDYESGNYPREDEWKYSSFWYKDFDEMAKKTMLRQLISKWGIMSTEMQTAFERDSGILDTDGKNLTFEYPDDDATEELDASHLESGITDQAESEQEHAEQGPAISVEQVSINDL